MPRYFLPFLCCLSLCWISCKKDLLHWQKVQQLDTHGAHRLNRILFVNDTLGFIAGGERFSFAEILITNDGGYTWTLRSFPQAEKELFGLTQSPSGAVYACGFDGKLLWSADAGHSWSFQQLVYSPFKAIAFADANHGIAVGGVSFEMGFMERIDSQGYYNSWDSLSYEMNDIMMLPGGTGYISGYDIMSKTTDGGTSWQFQDLHGDNFTALDVHNEREIWTCGYGGSIYKTTDGGSTWQRLRNGNNINLPRYHLHDLLFQDGHQGYAVGENGLVIYTDDGGGHWMELDRFTTSDLHNIASCPNGDLIVCGDNGALFRLLKK